MILGWHDATPRHLRAVARLHEARGHHTLAIVSDSGRALARRGGFSVAGRAHAARLAAAHAIEALPIVFHSFSNAGFWTLAATLDALALAHPEVLAAHRGTILDSAPGFPESIGVGYTARTAPMAFLPGLLARLGRPPVHRHRVLSPLLGVLFGLWHLSAPRRIAEMERAPGLVRAHHRAASARSARPILAIWGGADELVAPRFVEAFLASAAAEDIPTERIFLPTSGHVRHLVSHRATYEQEVRAFVERVIVPAALCM